MADDVARLVEAGQAALLAGDWLAAHERFAAAVNIDAVPAAVEGLGKAAYWRGDYPTAMQDLAVAYRAYRDDGRHPDAARVAIHLAQLHGLVHGDGAALEGWLAHAQRMLDADGKECPEAGWVRLFRGCITPDPAQREEHSRAAVDIGRRCDDPALEYDALGYLGKALVEQGDLHQGMALIDEAAAAAVGGIVADPWAVGEIYCTLFDACELALDVRRAEDWLAAVDRYVVQTGELPVRALCRMHYGGLLVTAGRWDDAEVELNAALGVYDEGYRGSRGDPLVRLADLRARQGRPEEARRLLAGSEDHPGAALPRARMFLADGQLTLAADLLQRRLAAAGRGLATARELALLVTVLVADGQPERARDHVHDLEAMATRHDQPGLLGMAALARARLVASRGGLDAAIAAYRTAMSGLSSGGLPWDLAIARLELAALVAPSRPEVACDEARLALDVLQPLGAVEANRAARLLRELGDLGQPRPRSTEVLTIRQAEVLALLAEGLTNQRIAQRLSISPRTVEDHVGNILQALGVDNRAQAAAHAIRSDMRSAGRRGPRH